MKTQYFDGVRVLCHIPRNLRESRGVIRRIDPSIEIVDITVRDGVRVNTVVGPSLGGEHDR